MLQFDHLREIFQAALDRIDPYWMIINHVRLEGETLVVAFEGERHEVDLRAFDRVLVLGAGKASARMAKAVEEILGQRVSEGLVSVKYGHAEPLKRVEVVESGHPTPDANGEQAARRMADLVRTADLFSIKPSVEDMATLLTVLSPRCCWTSATISIFP